MMRKKILPIILYSLPILFFIISYFVMTVSGEDIYQGANTAPNVLGDATAAFKYNARLSDMYAWSVINFFDYQFSFGIDFIFRLVDVLMGCGVIYLVAYFALGRKLEFNIKDAIIVNIIFITLFLSTHGYSLYGGFSLIHNYLIIILAPLLFLIPFIREKNIPVVAMLVLGIIFGLSSNLAPIAFLMTFGIILIVRRKIKMPPWKIAGLIGVITSIIVAFIFGPGVSSYTSGEYAAAFDYLSFSEIFQNLPASIPRIFYHEISNFSHILMPLVLVIAALFLAYFIAKKTSKKTIPKLIFSRARIRTITYATLFLICYTLTLSQIKSPIRLMLPAYIAGIIIVATIAETILDSLQNSWIIKPIYVAIPIISAIIVVTHGYLLIGYHSLISQTLTKIKNSDENSMCINRESVQAPITPKRLLTQEDMLIDWVMPVTLYNKTITFCEEQQ